MQIYEFDKPVSARLKELEDIIQSSGCSVAASEMKSQWSYYLELYLEPTGWKALWKIPRAICEESELRYPTVVFGIVEQVLFKEMKAIFTILAVEDEDVQLPERQEVDLEDLWVTIEQDNPTLNVEQTAESIDQLRFFYHNIWMPWDYDNDDDLDWVQKNLEKRVMFYNDLRSNNISEPLAIYIKMLLSEARNIQKRREYFETGLSDDEADGDSKDEEVKSLIALHLRMANIKSEIEMLENPDMRKAYEEISLNDKKYLKAISHTNSFENFNEKDTTVYIVSSLNTLSEHVKLLKNVGQLINENNPVMMLHSFQVALESCKSFDHIVLCLGEHQTDVLKNVNNTSISGLDNARDKILIRSKNDDSLLLNISGSCTLKNLTLDCRNVRNGIFIRNGNVILNNCEIIGDSSSSTRKGLVISSNSKLTLMSCTIKDFSTGILAEDWAEVIVCDSKIVNCRIGMEVKDKTKIQFDNSIITGSKEFGIWYEIKDMNIKVAQKTVFCNQLQLQEKIMPEVLPWMGSCSFENNKGNIVVWNDKLTFLPSHLKYE